MTEKGALEKVSSIVSEQHLWAPISDLVMLDIREDSHLIRAIKVQILFIFRLITYCPEMDTVSFKL